MKEYIKYNELDNDKKKYYLDLAFSAKLQEYIRMYTKLKKAGVTDLEILKLRGVPKSYTEVEEMLQGNKMIICIIDKDNVEFITRK